MTDGTLAWRLSAEALGMALLVAIVVGSGIIADCLTADDAVAPLASMLATGAILVVLITILAPISGAHLNPAVSLVFALRHELRLSDAGLYVLAQVAGAIAGTLLAHALFALPLLELSRKVRAEPAHWLAETVAAFGFVAVIIGGTKVPARGRPG